MAHHFISLAFLLLFSGFANAQTSYDDLSALIDSKERIEADKKLCESDSKRRNGRACDSMGARYVGPDRGVGVDYSKALFYFNRACEIDYYNGCYGLGRLQRDGLGGPTEYSKAIGNFKKTCIKEIGDIAAFACYDFGVMALKGQGMKPNKEIAIKAFELAISASPKSPVADKARNIIAELR